MSTEDEAEIKAREGRDGEVGPVAHAAFWFAIGCALIAVAQLPLALAKPPPPDSYATDPMASTSAQPASSTMPTEVANGGSPTPVVTAQVALVDEGAPPPAIRVVQLEGDPTLEVVSAKVGKRTCDTALLALGVTRRDMLRIDAAMKAPPVSRKLGPCHPSDRVFVAFEKASRRVRAFELESAPGDFVLAREPSLMSPAWAALATTNPDVGGDGGVAVSDAGEKVGEADAMIAQHFALPQTHKRHAVSFAITTDLASAIAASGLDPSILDLLDDALSSRADLPAPKVGTVLRIVADATYVLGRFDRYDELVAIEVRVQPESPPIRLYHQRDSKVTAGNQAWFDGKAKQPLRGKWRLPLTFARVTSRFNPKRMHPVLHTIQPHNGCDFAASVGTPVYSIAAGVVAFEGNSGPSGNLVTIAHEGGYVSGYAHLSRFVPGIVAGTHVEAHTVIAYSGTTGRSTGPHLHLSVKRAGVFIDPLSLKLDGVRVVPPSERDAFAARKADADAALDAIALPSLTTLAPAPIATTQSSASTATSAAVDDEPADEDQK